MQTASVKVDWRREIVATQPVGHAIPSIPTVRRTKRPARWSLCFWRSACTATGRGHDPREERQKLESLEVICSGERATEPPTVWIKLENASIVSAATRRHCGKAPIQLSEDKYFRPQPCSGKRRPFVAL